MKKYSQHINHQHIAKLLSSSTDQLDDSVLSALRQAHTVALDKQRVAEPVFSLSTIGHRAHHLMPHSTHQWIATSIILAAILIGAIGYWQDAQMPVDMEILTDDLPIEVFVDQHE
ncbi:MAG TPA: hypothetical protein DE312_10485 [Gallionella sp.]|nr:MAG: hypothetical protein A2Z87_01445 [Gallionellales bacterium GWA2_54_124]OGT17244.1 MAG: hypothetical protein A2522_05185 [Gallionellales bacterium RIFOXYD12_FULL_53_10]OGT25697.1 MAG: hypothetical protein A3K00_02430 [Gallionellales bacterium RIFOXYD2_FULL_52_7]HCI53721.1 hypothetical protein [Gallionella sp.]